jgi:hypothetical protein
MHNVEGCNKTMHYRCWLEHGFPLPRVEFLSTPNAMQVMLQPAPGLATAPSDGSPSLGPPSPHLPADTPILRQPGMRRRRRSGTPR